MSDLVASDIKKTEAAKATEKVIVKATSKIEILMLKHLAKKTPVFPRTGESLICGD